MSKSEFSAKTRRRRRPQPFRRLAVGLILVYCVSSVAYACLVATLVSAGHWHVDFRQAILPRLNDVVILTFFMVCGGSVGSFLNVVVWRMPQGMGVNGHSFCPRCRNRLRARDNVPVFGWLWIGGRCRDCRLPISSRYPIVEAAVAVSFGVIGTAELYGWNLPFVPPPHFDGLSSPMIRVEVFPILFFHLVGISIVWAMGLIRYDRNPIPSKLVRFAIVWLMGGLLIFPALAVVPWQLTLPEPWPPTSGLLNSSWLRQWIPDDWVRTRSLNSNEAGFDAASIAQSLVRIATAIVAAGFFARVLARAFCPSADLKLDPLGKSTLRLLDLVYFISATALLMGWQATAGVLLLASAMASILQRFLLPGRTDTLGYFSLSMPVSLILQLFFWRCSLEAGWWSDEQASKPYLLATAFGTLLIPLWLRESVPKEVPETESLDSQCEPDELNSVE